LLARVTYGLVVAALIALVLGIFVLDDNNTMLYVSIALSILCIALVVFGAARRAKYVSPEGEAAPEPDVIEATDDASTEVVASDEVLTAFDEDATWDDEEEEDEEEDEDDEEEEVSPAPRRSASKAKAAPKKAASRGGAKKTAAAATKTRAKAGSSSKKVVVVPGRDRYHTAGCRFVKGKDDTEEIAAATAKRRGYEPCSVCSPD